jgi:ABC-type lipoprotein export system ATPase subunit
MDTLIQTHITTLIETYNLQEDYDNNTKAVFIAGLNKESFYWFLLLFNKMLQKHPEKMQLFIVILVCIYGLNIFSQKNLYKKRNILVQKLNQSNIDFFQNKLLHMQKHTLLNFDFNRYFDTLTSIRSDFETYMITQKIKYDVPMKFITLIVIGINTQNPILIVLIPIFYLISVLLHNRNNEKTSSVIEDIYENENTIKKYMINSKLFIVNNELNAEYITEKVKELSNNTFKLNVLNSSIDTRIDVLVFIIVLINFGFRYNKIKLEEFLVYFYFVYDIEFLSEIMLLYNNGKKKYNEFTTKLNILYEVDSMEENTMEQNTMELNRIELNQNPIPISSVFINMMESEKPLLKLYFNEPLKLSKGNPLLVDGISGSGKSTFLYILKGVNTPTNIDITPSLQSINKSSYISLPKHRSVFSGNLFDIISNYEKYPDKEKIISCIEMFELNKALKITDNEYTNKYVNLETMSAGEQSRLLLARTVYNISKKDYSILLFDEIDENLNDELSLYVCKTLTDIFKDKIIVYITHNDKVKTLFTNRISIKEGSLN